VQHQQHRDAYIHRALTLVLLVLAVPFTAWALAPEPLARPTPRSDPDLGVAIGQPLRSAAAAAPPVMDGQVEAAWAQAPALHVAMHYGLHGEEPAGTVELRSLHDDERVYFLARWSSVEAEAEPGVWRNLLTVHWRLHDSGRVSGTSTASQGLACTVGCHTATSDGRGGLAGLRAETIPPGLEEDLPAAGGWSAGQWLLEWSRARISDSPYDQDLIEEQGYRFFVKLFLGLDGRPDPTSNVHELRLGP